VHPAEDTARESRFGVYRGHTQAAWDGYVRRSDYLRLADGTRLAYDLLLPTRGGVPAAEPLPVLFTLTPYARAMQLVRDGRVSDAEFLPLGGMMRLSLWLRAKLTGEGFIVDQARMHPWLRDMLRHGYAAVAVERRGTGASFGVARPSFADAAREADEILDWIARQPWSDGHIGMFGHSYAAMTQYAAASTGNPHLKAILPCSSGFDMYDALMHPGGIYNTGFNAPLPRILASLETLIVPVDSDPDGATLARARAERQEQSFGSLAGDIARGAPYRDSALSDGTRLWEATGLYTLLDRINRSGVPVYNVGGWLDIFTRDTFLWHENLTAPRRVVVRALFHEPLEQEGPDLEFAAEARRWFDAWLKGIENGIREEAPIHYRVTGAEAGWRAAHAWPPPEAAPTRFYLAPGPSGSVASVNDGGLAVAPPAASGGFDRYVVDPTTTTGLDARWNPVLGGGRYPDLRVNDAKGLTYTTPPLGAGTEITGHPVVHLWISSEAPDVDLFVYLEDVDESGGSAYVTEGRLRASHRTRSTPPFRNLGLPYRSGRARDVVPLPPGEPVEMVFDLLPLSRRFARGHRIRLTLTGADRDNFETPRSEPLPAVRVHREARLASFVELPVIPSD
jgi:putative CocE/NonD family hydrolase